MTARNLLVELLVEELPPKSLHKLGQFFAAQLAAGLAEQGLKTGGEPPQAYASPRRLAVWVPQVAAQAADQPEEKKVMPVSVARGADGKPTPALLKKLAALGLQPADEKKLVTVSDGKADVLVYRGVRAGIGLAAGLQAALDRVLAQLPVAKRMSYQLADGWTDVGFVRPAHALVALHGSDVVPVSALGLQAGRRTQGHRFEAAKPAIELKDADGYARQLETDGAVIASFEARRAEIQRQLQAAAAAQGLAPIDDEALLDEVTALVERPNVLTCRFDAQFLDVPQECLILTMKANQKYFPLLDAKGRLTDRFLVVSNIRPADPSAIVQGNERVVRPRLADAKFFFDQDRKKTLESRVPGLARVVYHNKLGTQGERVERVRALARELGQALGGAALAAAADRAALLAKADLLTDMVGEFPELQGVMGGYYARHDGETEAVALAVEDHYKPRYAGDELPRNDAGIAVALADKLETLAGLFSVGERPSGDRDPFALRRHALGVIRMVIERQLALELDTVLGWALRPFAGTNAAPQAEARAALADFFFDRLDVGMKEQGFTALEVAAVTAVMRGPGSRLAEVPRRLAAVRAFAALPEAVSLAAANKRVANILKKAERAVEPAVQPALLREAAEQQLHQALQRVQPKADALFQQGEYTASLRELAALKEPVDAFFDQVMVNADDEKLRNNRLALLAMLHAAMNRVADLSKLAA
jgi:glycyl-tRNA synthetase beta chain